MDKVYKVVARYSHNLLGSIVMDKYFKPIFDYYPGITYRPEYGFFMAFDHIEAAKTFIGDCSQWWMLEVWSAEAEVVGHRGHYRIKDPRGFKHMTKEQMYEAIKKYWLEEHSEEASSYSPLPAGTLPAPCGTLFCASICLLERLYHTQSA